MNKNIKFAVVGFGHIGKRHSKIILEHPEAELCAIVDIDEGKLLEAPSLGITDVPAFNNVDEFLGANIDYVDVVCICTPNYLHAPIALKALEEKYHVVIEKPMAMTKLECENVIFKSLNVSRNVFVVKQNRYSPPSKWLKEIVDTGCLGNTELVQINCYWNRDDRYYKKANGWKGLLKKDGGTLFTQFSHFIDIMYWIFGDVKDIQAKFFNFTHQESTEFEDSGLVNFEFINGGLGCINFSTACWGKNMESSITVIGEKGSVKVGGQYMNEVEYCHIENYEMPELEPTNPPNDYGPYKGSAANHHYIIQNVVDTLKGRSSIHTNALEGLKVVDIIERIYEYRDLSKVMKKKVK